MKKVLLSVLVVFTSISALQAQNWINFKNNDGAFSLHLPEEPKDFSTEVAVENEELDKVKVHIYMHTDVPNKLNYLVAYNDYPIGYYIQDQAATYDLMIEEFKEKSEILSVEDIEMTGASGKKVLMKLDKKTYTELRLFIRGNRLYKIMLQSLDAKATSLPSNDYFSSFKFEPYTSATLKAYTPTDENYSFNTFQKPRKVVDEEETDYKLYMQTINMYQTKNVKSGGTFLFEECEFSPYFKAFSLDSFYNFFREASIAWNDSLLKYETVMIDGKKGMTFTAKSGSLYKKHCMLVEGNKFYFLSGYSTLLDLEGADANSFFMSLKIKPNYGKIGNFDLYANKTKLLLKHLKSADEEERFRAKAAINFVVFDSTDVPDLCQALYSVYQDDSEEEGIRRLLLNELQVLNDATLIDFYDKLYKKEGTTDAIKEQLLINMYTDKSNKKYAYFTQNLFASPPATVEFNTWNLFSIFKDSVEYGIANFNQLQRFIDNSSYRSLVLGVANDLSKTKAGLAAIKQNEASVFKYLKADVDEFVKMLKADEYSYKSEIYAYLDILNHFKSPINATLISDKIAKSKAQSWIKTEAIYVRIFNGLKVKKKVKTKLMNELDSRFATILVYDRMGKLNEVPKEYITNEALAKLVIRNYFIEDGEAPSIINILGTIDHNGKTVYVTSCSYGEAWDKYIGLVGDFGTNGVDIKSIRAYTDWNQVEEDWKAQALKLLADFDEFAF